MDTQSRERPVLQPLWTEYHNLEGHPRTAFRVSRSPPWTASMTPQSPRTRLSPIYPTDAVYEQGMRRRERELVDSFDQRRKQQQGMESSVQISTADPDSRRSSIATQLGRVTMSSSEDRTHTAPLPSQQQHLPPILSSLPPPRRQTIVVETRSMLLSGMLQGQAGGVGASVDNKKLSEPNSITPATTSAVVVAGGPHSKLPSDGRRDSDLLRDELRVWGRIYLGNTASAACFVSAVAQRRNSDTPVGGDDAKLETVKRSKEGSEGKEFMDAEEGKNEVKTGKEREGSSSNDGGSSVTIRARVRPRALERKPFIIQRKFDIAQLRSTLPDSSPALVLPYRQPATTTPISQPPLESLRRKSAGARLTSPTGKTSRPGRPLEHGRGSARETNAVPIHIEYARVYLPILAALLLSGHVREGDVIDLPLPHPEAWPQTVAYVYTGQGELTCAIKRNILHLAGRV